MATKLERLKRKHKKKQKTTDKSKMLLICLVKRLREDKECWLKKFSVLMKYKKHFNELFNIADLKVS